MADPFDARLYDKRTAARHIRLGLLDEKAYEKYMKSLPDLADQALPVESALDDVDLDEEDDLEDEEDEAETEPRAGGPVASV